MLVVLERLFLHGLGRLRQKNEAKDVMRWKVKRENQGALGTVGWRGTGGMVGKTVIVHVPVRAKDGRVPEVKSGSGLVRKGEQLHEDLDGRVVG